MTDKPKDIFPNQILGHLPVTLPMHYLKEICCSK